MYDAVNPAHIPADAVMVAGYLNGTSSQWPRTAWGLFPKATLVRITVTAAQNVGQVLDVEREDATPDQAPGWVTRRRQSGVDPSVYCDSTTWPAVRAAFSRARVQEPHYWIAAHPGAGATIPPGAIAHQYADLGPVDVSVVADYWPGVDPPPTPEPHRGPPMTRNPLPPGALPIRDQNPVWKPDSSQLDLFLVGADGHCYHEWYTEGQGWEGPEVMDGPG